MPVEKVKRAAKDPRGVRSLRRDAEDNLARILVAARDVFAEQGYEAGMEQIAARADVGVGTLYRRFPRKSDLIDAVVEAARERTQQIAEEVVSGVPDEDAVFAFVRRCIAAPSCWRATIAASPWASGAGGALDRLTPLLREIVGRSQRAGTVRADLTAEDVVVTLMAVRSVADLCDAVAPRASQRFLDLALDGLRPGGDASAYPALTVAEVGRILDQRKG
jgi:AcrR family transcriptional regulator